MSIQNVLKLLRRATEGQSDSDTQSSTVVMSVRRKKGRGFVDFDLCITRCAPQVLSATPSPGACEHQGGRETEDEADEMFELMRCG